MMPFESPSPGVGSGLALLTRLLRRTPARHRRAVETNPIFAWSGTDPAAAIRRGLDGENFSNASKTGLTQRGGQEPIERHTLRWQEIA